MRRSSGHCLVGSSSFGLLLAFTVACGGPETRPSVEAEGPFDGGTLASALRARSGEPSAASDGATAGALALSWIADARPVTTTDEQTHLVLELIAQNASAEPQRIDAIDVFEPGRRRPLASFAGDELSAILLGGDEATGSIAPGNAAVAFFDLALGLRERLPARLRAVVRTAAGEALAAPAAEVVRERPIALSPPLRGENLVDLNGCCRGGHGRAVEANETGVFVAQRYAIDFLRAQGTASFEGDPSDNASYFIFGDDVHAAAPGRVVAVRDGMVENDPSQPLPPADLETAAGNYVVEALGGGRFALYAHLQAGSVRVQPGQRLRRGQVLGLVGNTGNSTEPHLHFHVMDRPSPLLSNGLPYVFDEFRLQAHVELASGEPLVIPTQGPERRENRLPLELDIVAFD